MDKHAVRPIEVLLVESDPAEVLIIKAAFLTAKIINNVRVVEDDARALDYLHARAGFGHVVRPDLMLLNSYRPGLELLAAVRADTEFAALPVGVLSSVQDQLDIERAKLLRADWFITKPFDADHLMDLVRTSVDFWLCVVTIPEGLMLRRRQPRVSQ